MKNEKILPVIQTNYMLISLKQFLGAEEMPFFLERESIS